MGLDIGLKLNKEVVSNDLKNQFYSWSDDDASDDIYCLSRGYCNLVLAQHFADSEPIIIELSRVLQFDCCFIDKPKANHCEEDEATRFQFGWVDSVQFLEKLIILKGLVDARPDFSKDLKLSNVLKYYFSKQEDGDFFEDISNLIKVLEIGNAQGVTEICYSVG